MSGQQRPRNTQQRRSQRVNREKKARGASMVGTRFEVEVGNIAHGGFCIARVPVGDDTRVVFVRHSLPGETAVIEITEGTEGDRFWRADAVEILTASADRVEAPCAVAGPGLCGGCDFQHVKPAAQRALKTAVVREQLLRIAKLDPADPLVANLVVEDCSGGDRELKRGLRWRTRTTFVGLPGAPGRKGLRKYRSNDVIEVDDCLITAPATADDSGLVTRTVEASAGTRDFQVASDGFWQVHPNAPRVLVDAVLEQLQPQPGEKALDLYAGVGLFAAYLAEAVGDGGKVVAIEGDAAAVQNAKRNLGMWRHASAVAGGVAEVLKEEYDEPFDLVVLDPPREGAKQAVVAQIVDRAPRAVSYVACDPAALARDVALFAEMGYRLTALRAFDLFPMTHHVECVAQFTRRDVS
ncbi:class I SAM-dependent RNA methyltransferase [Nocardioides jejuensis]|uniref:Class I SAM-dependent RNA methyltransferase n=1 Tax=Nocardioides jejuensis TaxID=2502782 RepID=A0A4V2NZY4_9ACTN|nr:methyltransferase [Nocardioides jejuensis]TCJ30852.1 class I SAM-dependent RNA methyltransferase [Nocardioides jejuensis]